MPEKSFFGNYQIATPVTISSWEGNLLQQVGWRALSALDQTTGYENSARSRRLASQPETAYGLHGRFGQSGVYDYLASDANLAEPQKLAVAFPEGDALISHYLQ